MSYQDFNQALAVRHAAQADVLLVQQCHLVKELKKKGHPHELAERLLMTMICTHSLMVDHANKIAQNSHAVRADQFPDQRLGTNPSSSDRKLIGAMRRRLPDRALPQSRLG
jgi:hypothetical protein